MPTEQYHLVTSVRFQSHNTNPILTTALTQILTLLTDVFTCYSLSFTHFITAQMLWGQFDIVVAHWSRPM